MIATRTNKSRAWLKFYPTIPRKWSVLKYSHRLACLMHMLINFISCVLLSWYEVVSLYLVVMKQSGTFSHIHFERGRGKRKEEDKYILYNIHFHDLIGYLLMHPIIQWLQRSTVCLLVKQKQNCPCFFKGPVCFLVVNGITCFHMSSSLY